MPHNPEGSGVVRGGAASRSPHLPAYLIVIDREVTDPAVLSEFADRMEAATHEFGGRYLVRGGAVDVVGGDVSPERAVVVEFADSDQARAMVKSDVFAELRAVRTTATQATAMIVQGV